jgi:hypothetical protein
VWVVRATAVLGVFAGVWLAGCGSSGASGDAGTGGSGGAWFEDVTAASGIDHARIPAEGYLSIADRMGGGVCVLDADGVPPLDLFFPLRSGESRLYVARAPFEYADETVARGLDVAGDAVGCLALDADGDGDDDLLVTGLGAVELYLAGDGWFEDATPSLGLSLRALDLYTSAAAGDLDGDGDLDVVVAGFLDADTSGLDADCYGIPCSVQVYSYPGIASLLLMRLDDGTYAERAAELAPDLLEPEPTLVVAVADLDGDGTTDIYVGNDAGDSYDDRALVKNADRVFRDAALRIGLARDARGHGIDTMGWTTGDVDGDGRLDHAVTTFAGRHSPVFLCPADAACEDRGPDVGTTARADTLRWGNALADFDLDGHVDLLEAAGHVYTVEEGAGVGFELAHEQPPNLFRNRGDGTLEAVEPLAGDALALPLAARGLAVADLDDDGRLDAVLATSNASPRLLRNVQPPAGHWLRVELLGPSAVGTRVVVRQQGRTLVRARTAGEGYLGSFDPRLIFGLPTTTPVDVEVHWPDGTVTERTVGSVDGAVRIER